MDALLGHVKTNIVQSIRAHRVTELQQAAKRLGHHFLYASCLRLRANKMCSTSSPNRLCWPRIQIGILTPCMPE